MAWKIVVGIDIVIDITNTWPIYALEKPGNFNSIPILLPIHLIMDYDDDLG